VRRARPRRGALGLRGRIIGVVLVTAAATLAVAAVALLGPLEHSLRQAALNTLSRDLQRSNTNFKRLDLDIQHLAVNYKGATDELDDLQRALGQQIGGTATVLGYAGADGGGNPLTPPNLAGDYYNDATRAFLTHHQNTSFGSINATEYARAALPFEDHGQWFVLAVRRPIDEIPGAVHAVRTAFLTAALAALALTVILGIPLSATLVRRLRRLRQAALRLAEGGPPVELPVDRARDEVGDLGRTFALMQRQLQHQEEARRAFVATASHELRTPLASLDGMLELLGEELQSPEPDIADARMLLERARAQSRRLGRLAADLLDLSRLDADVQLRSEPVELGELSRAVLAEFEIGTAERGLTAELDDSAGPVWARGDPGSVARILRILLDNAVRVSPVGGEITVRLENGGHATLSVCDQGPGIPPDEREMIFERFQRGRRTGGEAGFGLGLAIGRELAVRMGGELWLEADHAPGAKFVLRLPVTRAADHDMVVLG
jgi:signal transduction histidine kinase